MSTETKSALATAFAILAVFAAIASATLCGITAITLSNQIQDGRVENVERYCNEVNDRNDKAYVFLSALPVNPNGPKLSSEARAKLIHGFTDALVGPKRPDCAAYADSLVRP